jgi:hypothetical protein
MLRGVKYRAENLFSIASLDTGMLAPGLHRFATTTLTRGMPTEEARSCRQELAVLLPDTRMQYELEKLGVKVIPTEASEVPACLEPFTIPYSRITSYLNTPEATRLHWTTK